MAERHAETPFPWATIIAIGFVFALLATGFTLNFSQAPFAKFDYFGLQADSLLDGQLALPLTPDEARLDMSVFGDEVHLYWGIGNCFPALVLGVMGLRVSPALWVSLAAWFGVLLFSLICHRSARGLEPTQRGLLTMVFVLTLGVGTAVGAVTAWSSSMHNQSLVLSFAAQMLLFFVFLGWLEKPSMRWGIALGLALALAVNVRLTTLHLALGLGISSLLVMRWRGMRLSEMARHAALPVVIGALGLVVVMLFNALRFDHPLETGMGYQVAMGGPLREHPLAPWFISMKWIPQASWVYLLRPPEFAALLPATPWATSVAVPWLQGVSVSWECQGVLVMTPALFFGLLAFGKGDWTERERAALPLLLAALLPFGFLLCYYTMSRRFTLDFVPALLLVAHLMSVRHLRLHPRHFSALFSLLSVMLAWSALAHWPLMFVGARKVLAILMLAEEAPYARIDLAVLVPITLLLGVAIDVLRFGRSGSRPGDEL